MSKEEETAYMFIRYIQKVLYNEKLKYIRNQKKSSNEIACEDELLKNISYEEVEQLEKMPPTEIHHMEEYINNIELFNSIINLSTKEKFILYKKYVEEKKDKDIGNDLNISSQAVSKQKRKIIKKIHQNLIQ